MSDLESPWQDNG